MRVEPLENRPPVAADWRKLEEELGVETVNVLESINEAFVSLDPSWRLTYVNAQAERIYGMKRGDLLGRNFWQVFPEAVGTTFETEYRRAMTDRVPGRVEEFYKPLGRWFEVSVVPARTGGLAFYFRDISGRKQTAALVEGQKQALELALRGAPLDSILEVLTRTVEAQSGDGVLASILLLDAEGRRLRHGAAPSLPESYIRATDGLAIGPCVGSCGTAAYTGQTIVVSDIETDPLWAEFRNLARKHGLRACWSAPIFSSKGGVLGTFALYYREARHPAPRDREVVELLLHTAAIVIERQMEVRERIAAEQGLSQQVEALTRLHALAMRLAGDLELQPALQTILETLVEVHGADFGLLSLYDAESGCLRPEASVGLGPAALRVLAEVRPGVTMGACGRAFATRERVIVEDTDSDPAFECYREFARETGFRAVHSTPILTRSGEILGALSVHLKVGRRPTQREMQLADLCARHAAGAIETARTEQARRQAEDQLRESDRRKDEFLATLAHELRNPLAPLRNGLHILRAVGGTGPAARVHEMMERQVNHLVRLVDDLLEISRITRGKIELCKERVDLAAIVLSAVETSRPLIESAGHRLDLSLPPEPLTLEADAVRLAQVVANLLNNAAKFTEAGGQIRLTAQREGDFVKLSVRDTGIGIAPDMLSHVFDMFMQADRSPGRTQDGLGIGLTLVRSLVQMHGGSVEARSEGLGKGSELIVRLPLAAERPVPGTGTKPRESPVLAARRILLIDDNRDAADSLALLLELLGAEVQAVYDGPSALAALEARRPTVVLLDIGMPGMDGYEVARRIRQQPQLQDVPIIALTGWGQEEDRRRARDAGFDHHLIKPVDIDALKALLISLDSHEPLT